VGWFGLIVLHAFQQPTTPFRLSLSKALGLAFHPHPVRAELVEASRTGPFDKLRENGGGVVRADRPPRFPTTHDAVQAELVEAWCIAPFHPHPVRAEPVEAPRAGTLDSTSPFGLSLSKPRALEPSTPPSRSG
jgi:hypothetical protein